MIRATDLCLRGSRVSWRSGTGTDDRAGLLPFCLFILKFVFKFYSDYVYLGTYHR